MPSDAPLSPHPHARYPELDLLRSLAVAMMVVYHAAYDLEAFEGWNIGVADGAWWLLARSTLTLFLLLVGVSFAISWDRSAKRYGKYLRRGLGLLGCGMLVSAATFIADPATFVRFGVLHLIGASMLILPVFARLGGWNALVGAAVVAAGWRMGGWPEPAFASVDYVPPIPWFGVILLGYAAGDVIYVMTKHPPFSILFSPFFIRAGAPGRHALAIYLLHQPALLAVLAAIDKAISLSGSAAVN